jgi:hypothetical protein
MGRAIRPVKDIHGNKLRQPLYISSIARSRSRAAAGNKLTKVKWIHLHLNFNVLLS